MLAGEPPAVIAFPLQNPPEALHRAVINAMGNTGHTFNAELYVWFLLLGKKAPGPSDSYCIAHCIDNGPMEGFWGILKRERYYGRRFTSKRDLVQMIGNYIHYYNTRRVQRNLGILMPMEKHLLSLAA